VQWTRRVQTWGTGICATWWGTRHEMGLVARAPWTVNNSGRTHWCSGGGSSLVNTVLLWRTGIPVQCGDLSKPRLLARDGASWWWEPHVRGQSWEGRRGPDPATL